MDLWQRARGFAEEAAKRSQEISKEAAKRSQELVSKSRELAAEATKTADLIKTEALRRADQIKTLAGEIPIPPLPPLPQGGLVAPEPPPDDLQRFGITEELREFVKGITMSTFRDFPMEDEPPMSEVPMVSNVRQDLNEWQARHATLVLSTVKEISKFRYELCPRYMKERKFWRIYFILVNNFVVSYEKQYMEELSKKSLERNQNDANENQTNAPAPQVEGKETKLQSKTSTSSTAEQDLDVFLLGDLGSSDDGPDDGDDAFDDDFDKIGSTSGLDSEDDDEKKSKK